MCCLYYSEHHTTKQKEVGTRSLTLRLLFFNLAEDKNKSTVASDDRLRTAAPPQGD